MWKRKVPQCVCPVTEQSTLVCVSTGWTHRLSASVELSPAAGCWRQPLGARKEAQRNPRAGGGQPPVVTTPVTSFTSLNYYTSLLQNECFCSAVGLRQSRLIRAETTSLMLKVASRGVLEIWTISGGVSGSVRKDSCVDPSGDMMWREEEGEDMGDYRLFIWALALTSALLFAEGKVETGRDAVSDFFSNYTNYLSNFFNGFVHNVLSAEPGIRSYGQPSLWTALRQKRDKRKCVCRHCLT